ncbi:MAG: SIMPL domain-containing protein [Colwellia polaris]|jgi:uncharacterized protein YggE|uniref:SIMPL domain-containing protein n=1 Tax=Colwellia polaris TaxID=326537 RepID=UPI000A17853D|nr:SIMPL domain-containing protein [Colwellia polaris]|tara:strand:+ start:7007 stop:7735 length:729 start_codon:yes stop_codon:yes gene_type:complete
MKFSTSTLLVTLLLSFCSFTFANNSLPTHRHISVTGTAELMTMPDIAVLHLNVESEQKTSLEAKKEVDLRVNNLLDGLVDFDINEDNVSASNISTEIRRSYNRGEQDTIEGYIARRTLKVTLNNIDKLNAFMDFVLSVKINAIRNIELTSSNQKQLQQEVNALAVSNAKSKGKSLANAFDAELGAIYSINASSNQSYHRYGANNEGYKMRSSMADSAAKPGRYLQENIVFSATIDVVFDLEL